MWTEREEITHSEVNVRCTYIENLLELGPEEKKLPKQDSKDHHRCNRRPRRRRLGEPASVGHRIQSAHPDFDPHSSYGCANLSTLVEKSGGFYIRKQRGTVHVRRKVAVRKGSDTGKGSTA